MALRRLFTVDDLMEIEDDGYRYELIDGELIRMAPASPEHGLVGSRFGRYVGVFADQAGLGETFDSSIGYRLVPGRQTVLQPDVSFVRADRLPPRPWDAYFAFPPDVALEVRSPSERRGHVTRKVRIYLAAGASYVFYADPKKRNVTVYRPGQPPLVLSEHDVLDADDVLPGFRLPVARLFE
jgi:Uma2 family endonuclease